MDSERYVSLSPEGTASLEGALSSLPRGLEEVDWTVATSSLRTGPLAGEVRRLARSLRERDFLILRLDPAYLDRHGVWGCQAAVRLVARLLGRVMPQNEAGEQVITVYDRDARDRKNPRYTQTSRGGILHTDRASSPDDWNCLLLACLAPAMLGGDTVLVHVERLHRFLAERFPRELAVLEGECPLGSMLFPGRRYAAPVLRNEGGRATARYLRFCIDAGCEAQGVRLSDAQIGALDVLDASLEMAELQERSRLEAGEVLIALDDRIFHGRTAFADAPGAIPAIFAVPGDVRPLKRTMERLWVDAEECTDP